MAVTKHAEKEVSRDHILQMSSPDKEFGSSLEGTGEPWQVLSTRRAGTGLCFREAPLAFSLRVAGRKEGKTGTGDQGGC